MADFDDLITEWIEETETKIDEALQIMVIKIGTSLVSLSPVDTGLFRGNWQLSINTGVEGSINRHDQAGAATLDNISRIANRFTAGQVAYIQNHIEYGAALEHGYSRQAPAGIVSITELRFRRIVEEAVRLVK